MKIFSTYKTLKGLEKIAYIANIPIGLGLLAANIAPYISPGKFLLFSFIGMAFPIWLCLNIFFFCYWLLRKKMFFLFSLVLFLSSYNNLRRFIQIKFINGGPSPTEIQVMSFNVRLFDLYNWSNHEIKRNKIVSFLKDENPDILCLQEYFYTSGGHFDTRDTLLKLIDAQEYFENFTTIVNEKRGSNGQSKFGSAIFSKYPIVNKGVLSFPGENSNNAIYIDIKVNDDTIRVYNAHIGSLRFQKEEYNFLANDPSPQSKGKQRILQKLARGFKKREAQVNFLLDKSLQSPYKTIICTDLNDTPNSYAYQLLKYHYNDAFTISGNGISSTYNGQIPFLRIDYIWHCDNLASRNYKVYKNDLSDHNAVGVTIGW